jgi:hypothetical protein
MALVRRRICQGATPDRIVGDIPSRHRVYQVGSTMIIGLHAIINSRNSDADRAFLRDVLKFSHVDVGHGWLIFGLPPSELAVHPTEGTESHELYLMCKDVEEFIQAMKTHSLACTPVRDAGWGLLTQLTLPGGGKLGVYQPRHARPKPSAGIKPRTSSKKSLKKPKKATRRRSRPKR